MTKAIYVTVPGPQSIGCVLGDASKVVLSFDRPLSDRELRALHILSQGGFPTICLAPEELRSET